ncbi:acyltransferase family protein [Phocaeicola sp.]
MLCAIFNEQLMILNKLQRPINPKSYIACIDGFRFFAIFTVCLLHINNYYGRSIGYDYYQGIKDINSWSWFINRCGLGVELFFAISGFVIALPFFRHYLEGKEKPSLKSYFYRRITRLEVPFLLSCVLIYTGYIWQKQISFGDEIGHLLSAMTYTHTFIYGVWPPFNSVIWSLETEIQFYIITPWLIAFLFSGKKPFLRYGKFILIMAISLYLRSQYNELETWHLHRSVLVNLPYFLIGFIIAEIYIQRKSFLEKQLFIWDFIGISCFYLLFRYAWANNQLYFCIALLVLFISIFKGHILHWFCSQKIIYVIGGMCYTIYLLHYPLFHLTGKITEQIHPFNSFYYNLIMQAMLLLPIVFIICSCYFVLIEKPCMNKSWPQLLYSKLKKVFIVITNKTE